jgi:hypothetical protein
VEPSRAPWLQRARPSALPVLTCMSPLPRPLPRPTPGLWSGAPLSQFTVGAELQDGRQLPAEELQAKVLQAISLQ